MEGEVMTFGPTFKGILGAVFIASLSGCAATTTMAPEAEDLAAKEFAPKEGEANIYVVRKGGFAGSAVALEVMLDGRTMGTLAPDTFLLIEVQPGPHIISCHTQENQEIGEVEALAGMNYFFELSPEMGWISARCSLEAIDQPTGSKLVLKASLAEDLQIEE